MQRYGVAFAGICTLLICDLASCASLAQAPIESYPPLWHVAGAACAGKEKQSVHASDLLGIPRPIRLYVDAVYGVAVPAAECPQLGINTLLMIGHVTGPGQSLYYKTDLSGGTTEVIHITVTAAGKATYQMVDIGEAVKRDLTKLKNELIAKFSPKN